jgi:hypothetical protein
LQFEKQNLEKLAASFPQPYSQYEFSTDRSSTYNTNEFNSDADKTQVWKRKVLSIAIGSIALFALFALIAFSGNDQVSGTTSTEQNRVGESHRRLEASLDSEEKSLYVQGSGRDMKQKKKHQHGTQPIVTPPIPLSANDLDIWHKFYDELSGPRWTSCNSYDSPCDQGPDCTQSVKCEIIEGEQRIVEIKMRNNKLHGFIPGFDLDKLDKLRILDLSNDVSIRGHLNKIRATDGCFGLERCTGTDLTCAFDGTELGDADLTYCSTKKTLNQDDLEAWQALYDATNGQSWTTCADYYDDPCSCQGADQFIVCDWLLDEVLRITAIILPNNNMDGELPDLYGFDAVRQIDLSGNQELSGCIGLDCDADGGRVQCKYDGLVNECEDDDDDDEDDGMETISTSDYFRLDNVDLQVWHTIYDDLNGAFWRFCQDARENPCAFSQCVTCEPGADSKMIFKIVEIYLGDNGMSGELPIDEIGTLVSLRSFDASSSNANDQQTRNLFTNPSQPCLTLPANILWNLTDSGLVICQDGDSSVRRRRA